MTLDVHIQRLGTARQVFIDKLHLSVAPGQILTLMGPSGSGKSSLLAAVAGTLTQDSDNAVVFDGSVLLNRQDISQRPSAQRGMGLLFQDALLFAHMTVAQNLLFAVPQGPRAARLEEVQKALDDAGLPDFGERDPGTLSGGQRARIALMRALLARPRALLLRTFFPTGRRLAQPVPQFCVCADQAAPDPRHPCDARCQRRGRPGHGHHAVGKPAGLGFRPTKTPPQRVAMPKIRP